MSRLVREFMNFRYDEYPFELFSVSHLVAIIVLFGCMMGLYVFRSNIQGHTQSVLKWMLVVFLVLSESTFQMWYILNDRWDVAVNLPFQLCSLSLYLCAIMLITKSYRVFEINFFVSMSGAFIAIITPELFFGFPHFRYFQFFSAHMVIVLSCLYMVWIEGYRLTFSSLVRAFLALNVMAIIVYVVDVTFGANYMFLIHKPYNANPIDYLGDYPWYLLSLEGVSLFLFSLLYSPFFLLGKKETGNM